jgi:serine/threonine protein kinase
MDQLGTIVAVLGTSDLHAYISKTKIEMSPEIRKVIAKYTLLGRGPKQDWETLARQHILDQHRRVAAAKSLSSSSSSSSSGSSSSSSTTTTTPTEELWPMPSPEGLDLLSKLLIYDHSQRLTAKQAMQHMFFDKVRDRVEAELRDYDTYRGALG